MLSRFADAAENPEIDRRPAPARLSIDNGLPRSMVCGDLYHPVGNAHHAADHVFIEGNNLGERLGSVRGCFTIAELGFGAGLNFLAARRLWRMRRRAGSRLVYIGLDNRPLVGGEIRTVHRLLGTAVSHCEWLAEKIPPRWAGWHFTDCGDGIDLILVHEEALAALQAARFSADAWFLDGFSPACNPDMWSAPLLREVARHTKPGGTAATYSSAGKVRRNLAAAGFAVRVRPGYAGKRENLSATMPGKTVAAVLPHAAAVFGAGIAGAAVARALARRGVDVELFDANSPGVHGASGNCHALLTPHVTSGMGTGAQIVNACFGHASRLAREMGVARQSGALLLAHSEETRKRQDRILRHAWPDTLLRAADSGQASELAGIAVPTSGIYYPSAAMVNGAAFVRAMTGNLRSTKGKFLFRSETGIRAWCSRVAAIDGRVEVLCLGQGLCPLLRGASLLERPGAVARFAADEASANLLLPLLLGGYVIPCDGRGNHHMGMQIRSINCRDDVRDACMRLTARLPPVLAKCVVEKAQITWSATRVSVPDHLPVAGSFLVDKARPPVYLLGALGSRGLTTAPLLGEALAAQICGEPAPLPASLLDAISPDRLLFCGSGM